MANNMVKIIKLNGAPYEISEWFGICSSSSTAQTKFVTINGFSTNSLVNGTRVTVYFSNAQSYSGTTYLNVNSTGAHNIRTISNQSPAVGEWNTGEIVTFIFYSSAWYIENGGHASVAKYGRTKLSDSYDGAASTSLAATTYALQDAYMRILSDSLWDGKERNGGTLCTLTTPAASSWEDIGGNGWKYCDVSYASIEDDLDDYMYYPRILKITFHDNILCWPLKPFVEGLSLYYSDEEIDYSLYNDHGTIGVPSEEAGAYTFKMELYLFGSSGIVTYPTLTNYLDNKGYLTLADLPIYDGSVT